MIVPIHPASPWPRPLINPTAVTWCSASWSWARSKRLCKTRWVESLLSRYLVSSSSVEQQNTTKLFKQCCLGEKCVCWGLLLVIFYIVFIVCFACMHVRCFFIVHSNSEIKELKYRQMNTCFDWSPAADSTKCIFLQQRSLLGFKAHPLRAAAGGTLTSPTMCKLSPCQCINSATLCSLLPLLELRA